MLLRLALRVASLAAKFGLTIAIARELGFAAVGEYGLAVATSVIASKLGGLGFSAELNREMSGHRPADAIRTARSLRKLYVAFYLLVGTGLLLALVCGRHLDLPANKLLYGLIFLVAVSEHYALEVNAYLFSLHLSRAASGMLFSRTGGWAIVASAGLMCGVFSSIGIVLVLWLLTNVFVIVGAWALLSRIPAQPALNEIMPTRSMFSWKETWMAGAPFYVGGVLLAGLQYAERFVASIALPAAEVGRYVFVWSIANAVQTIAYATVNVTAGPRLARAAVDAKADWSGVFLKSLRDTIVIGVSVAVGIACVSPIIFRMTNETLNPTILFLLAILLASFLLRAVGDLLWSAAIARRARRHIVITMFSAAALASPLAWWLIPRLGVTGVAIAHALASVSVLIALWWAQRQAEEKVGVSDA
ncbi:polysaccharide biosynthesis protein [Caballeronia arvi]|uniref:Polysaccharide biosynthesis protein n=1 Tax=Caballeronia arvi TaxID=1777135 RepID=A0A158KN35_9BURK|nr:polysaccharide biosynthesis C-terminal domain-containing protein [Caballeronia arvi]SAL82547.1 polysaccharide biosynthesis protein [Caballeronia arvi]